MKVIFVKDNDSLKQFQQEFSKSPVSVLSYTAPWCGACQQFKPRWTTACENAKGNGLLANIPQDFFNELEGINNDVKYLPTIKIFKNGKFDEDWGGNWGKPGSLDALFLKMFSTQNKTNKLAKGTKKTKPLKKKRKKTKQKTKQKTKKRKFLKKKNKKTRKAKKVKRIKKKKN